MLVRPWPRRNFSFIFRIWTALLFVAMMVFYLRVTTSFLYHVDYLSDEEKLLELEIENDEKTIIPGFGDSGEGVQLFGDDLVRGKEDVWEIGMNEHASRKIAYNRSLADPRNPKCADLSYDEDLPSVSIIIIFYNEPYSTILRTVRSALDTTGRYLEDIILVDDFSTVPELRGKLTRYIETRMPAGKVKLIRLPKKTGVIGARLTGAQEARGEVLFFLDAHCECTVDWHLPLLQRIKQDRTVVVSPIIDVIDIETFHYYKSVSMMGGFNFRGDFVWITSSGDERIERRSEIAPLRSPTIAGGIFAIDSSYFWKMGSYDEDMFGWGGENLEMSFRIWQCGGSLEIIPCSRIGHIFRDVYPYGSPDEVDVRTTSFERNSARLAKVWMDDYAKYFFRYRPYLDNEYVIGDISSRQLLRQKLNCKSFEWYLNTVYPEKFVYEKDVVGYGRIKNPATDLCIDLMDREETDNFPFGLFTCYPYPNYNQYISLTLDGRLRSEMKCAQLETVDGSDLEEPVVMNDCHFEEENQRWTLLSTNQIQHLESGLCLDATDSETGDDLFAFECDENSVYQQWIIEFNQSNDFGKIPSDFNAVDVKNESIWKVFKSYGQENLRG